MMKKVINKIKKSSSAKKTTGKKTSSRKTLKKLSNAELFPMIQKKAFEIYARRGYTHGGDVNDWCEAEKIVMSQYKK